MSHRRNGLRERVSKRRVIGAWGRRERYQQKKGHWRLGEEGEIRTVRDKEGERRRRVCYQFIVIKETA